MDWFASQSNETGGSAKMEKGLRRCLSSLPDVTVEEIVHSQIEKFLQDNHPEVRHSFDTWHIVKGIS